MKAHLNMPHFLLRNNGRQYRCTLVYVKEALELPVEEVEFVKGTAFNSTKDYRGIGEDLNDLERCGCNLEQIKRQMQRFSDDF